MNNKNRIDSYIPLAVEALEEFGFVENGKIDKSYRGQISSFGATVAIGSFKQAVAFFSHDAKTGAKEISRSKLISAINYVVNGEKQPDALIIRDSVFAIESKDALKTLENKYLDAAVAIKNAMNLFDLV